MGAHYGQCRGGVTSAIVDNIPVMFAVALGYFASVGVHLWLSR